uniref:Uncharacterized protein n=1 Tax=Xiphophorus couchianus TaxID=32473 RepID=A0A3B5L0E1_9TELE
MYSTSAPPHILFFPPKSLKAPSFTCLLWPVPTCFVGTLSTLFLAGLLRKRLWVLLPAPTGSSSIPWGNSSAIIEEHTCSIDKDNVSPKAPEVLCRQSLSLVYSTIEENYPEGTLQLLSDLLQPGFYPPKDITTHLLRGILLDPHCPHHLSLQAYNLLMRTQRHHRANRSSVPWDWELLTSVMSNQLEQSKQQYYCVQTLEDDFTARCSSSSLSHSIAKATLSCDRQFSRVRDVIKWLFCVIMKTTENEDSKEGIKIKDEQIRYKNKTLNKNLLLMLSLALEVDRSPALNSAKLSHELFHMTFLLVICRMLLLESLQSKLLSCKLLEQLLDYACPEKVSIPMSLKLLLHFLKNCTLDGLERWRKWEELIHLLWMLLLSYSKAMKGELVEKGLNSKCCRILHCIV